MTVCFTAQLFKKGKVQARVAMRLTQRLLHLVILRHSRSFYIGHSWNINVEVLPTIFREEKYGPRVGIRLDWGRQISAHVFINRAQSSLSFMQLEWGGNSRLAVDSGPLELLFVPERPYNSKFWVLLIMAKKIARMRNCPDITIIKRELSIPG